MGKDYYGILGLDKNASAEEIRSAYKKLAKKFHPDVSSEANAEEKFKEVQEAYSVLNDPQKKSSYDRFGSDFSKFGGAGQGFGGFDFSGGDFGFEDLFSGFSGFRDIFDMFGRRQSHGPRKGIDIQVKLNLTFEEAVFGAEKEIKLERVEQCPDCQGSGAEKGSDIITCPDCQGRGVKQVIRKTFLGVISTASTCPRCQGEGKVIKNLCPTCQGSGHIKAKRKIKVKVPAGIDTGNTLRLSGEGHAGERGGLSGDVYVTMFVEPHEVFKRDGSDVLCEIPLTFSEAALGTEIEVPTLKGKAVLKVPSGTQTSTIFRMKGKGIKVLGSSGYGDQFVKVNVQTPSRLSKAQRKIFEELAGTEETKKERKSFFDSLKKSFKS